MPSNIRAILSVVVALVTIVVFALEARAGQDFLKWFVLVLGGLMIGAVWLFPETKSRANPKT